MVGVKIDLDRSGVGQLLTSSEVQRMLESRAEAVAQAARGRGIRVDGIPGDVPLPIDVIPAGDSHRARALVVIDHPSALSVEAKHRLLAGALDAAR